MEHDFQRCNSCYVLKGDTFKLGNKHDILNAQKKYIKSGFVPDIENDLYVRPGYGALMFFCGNCSTFDMLKNDPKYGDCFYTLANMAKEGYRLVIGPGVMNGYAVFCSNYEEILNIKNRRNRQK